MQSSGTYSRTIRSSQGLPWQTAAQKQHSYTFHTELQILREINKLLARMFTTQPFFLPNPSPKWRKNVSSGPLNLTIPMPSISGGSRGHAPRWRPKQRFLLVQWVAKEHKWRSEWLEFDNLGMGCGRPTAPSRHPFPLGASILVLAAFHLTPLPVCKCRIRHCRLSKWRKAIF